jgi:hypothetical protein
VLLVYRHRVREYAMGEVVSMAGAAGLRVVEAYLARVTSAELYAVLRAVGCPLLAILLTDFHPLDPLEERIALQKRWLCEPFKRERGGERSFEVVHQGFLVLRCVLEPLSEYVVENWDGDDVELDARVVLDREIERLIELAETGFETPEMEGFFDRYIDEYALAMGWYETALEVGLDCNEEELRALLALGVGEPVWAPDGRLDRLKIKVRRASELPAEVREWRRRWDEPDLLRALKELAGLLGSPATRGSARSFSATGDRGRANGSRARRAEPVDGAGRPPRHRPVPERLGPPHLGERPRRAPLAQRPRRATKKGGLAPRDNNLFTQRFPLGRDAAPGKEVGCSRAGAPRRFGGFPEARGGAG